MFTIPKSWFKGKGSGGRVNVTRVYVTMASRRPPHPHREAVVIFFLCAMCQSVLCPRARLSILEGLKRGQPQSQKGAI